MLRTTVALFSLLSLLSGCSAATSCLTCLTSTGEEGGLDQECVAASDKVPR